MFLNNPATSHNARGAIVLPVGAALIVVIGIAISGTVQEGFATFALATFGVAITLSLIALTALFFIYGPLLDVANDKGKSARLASFVWSGFTIALAALAVVYLLFLVGNRVFGYFGLLRPEVPIDMVDHNHVWVFVGLLSLNLIAVRLVAGPLTDPEDQDEEPDTPALRLHPKDVALLVAALDTHRADLTRQYRKTRRRNADELPCLLTAIDRIDTIKTEIRKAELHDFSANPRRHSTPTS